MEAVAHQQAVLQADRAQSAVSTGYDPWLIGGAVTLLCIGLVMVVSTSVSIAERRELDALH